MRKSPTINPRICKDCGREYTPSGTTQQFCPECSSARDRRRKREWYERNFPDRKPREKCPDVCCVCGGPFSCSFDGKPYCNKHWQRMYHNGTTEPKKRARTNSYDVRGDITIVTTSDGRTFTVDTIDLDSVQRYSWCFSKTGYLVANVGGKVVRLHRYLLHPDDGSIVDHINGDPSDNRRSNLRVCGSAGNARNSRPPKSSKLGILGVKKVKSGKYVAQIMVDRKQIHLGRFANLDDAIAARAAAELKYYGEFAPSISRTSNKTPGDSE